MEPPFWTSPLMASCTTVLEMAAWGELRAGAEDAEETPDDQLRKQMINTIASFVAQLSNPMAATVDPLEADVWSDDQPAITTAPADAASMQAGSRARHAS